DIDAFGQRLLAGAVAHPRSMSEQKVTPSVHRGVGAGSRKPVSVFQLPYPGAVTIIEVQHIESGIRAGWNANELCLRRQPEQAAHLRLIPAGVEVSPSPFFLRYRWRLCRRAREYRQVPREKQIQRDLQN